MTKTSKHAEEKDYDGRRTRGEGRGEEDDVDRPGGFLNASR
jgi:hypothetical protein